MLTVTNPWHHSLSTDCKRTLTYTGPCLLRHRDVEVYKNPAGSWDYTYKGMAITQRAGMSSLEAARKLIDSLLAGEELTTCDTVRAHIASHQTALAQREYLEATSKAGCP